MTEVLGITSLGDLKYFVFCVIDYVCGGFVLSVSHVGDLAAGGDKSAKDALFLDYLGIVLDVERVGNHLSESSDIILSARFVIYSLAHEGIDESYDVDLAVGDKELAHGEIYLCVLGDIEVGGAYRIRYFVEGIGVDKDRSEKRLLGDQRERHFPYNFFVHFNLFGC